MMAMADDDTVVTQPAYKTVELRFGDAAVVLRGDGSLDGDLDAFTEALETINPAADDVAFAVGWLVANQLRRVPDAELRALVFPYADPDPGDADPTPGVDERPIAVDDGIRDRLSERATHEAAQARDYNA